MTEPNTSAQQVKRKVIGVSLILGGLTPNYLFERHNIFKLWENSSYPISWTDVSYPAGLRSALPNRRCVGTRWGKRRDTLRGSLVVGALTALLPTVFYTLFCFGMQFVATGADRLGECPGLDQAAANYNVIPESKMVPGRAGVGCAVERRGIFLSYYNDLEVYGVSDVLAQQEILDKLAEQYRRAHTPPLQVRFFGEQNVLVRERKGGAVFRSARPVKLIRVVNIG